MLQSRMEAPKVCPLYKLSLDSVSRPQKWFVNPRLSSILKTTEEAPCPSYRSESSLTSLGPFSDASRVGTLCFHIHQ